MPTYTHLTPPSEGTAISVKNGQISVPANPIVPFIEGDGTGPDIWRASVRVFDAAVEKAFGGSRKMTTSTFSGARTGDGTPRNQRTGRRQT